MNVFIALKGTHFLFSFTGINKQAPVLSKHFLVLP